MMNLFDWLTVVLFSYVGMIIVILLNSLKANTRKGVIIVEIPYNSCMSLDEIQVIKNNYSGGEEILIIENEEINEPKIYRV